MTLPIDEVADGTASEPGEAGVDDRQGDESGLDASGREGGGIAHEPRVDDVDVSFMRAAYAEAEAAGLAGDVPIGAVVVRDGIVFGRGRNRREIDADPTGHAELVALREAAAAAASWRLVGATVYATLEPCPMCAGALVNARVARVVYACADPKAGAIDTLFEIGRDPRLNHRFEVTSGVLAAECAALLKAFFAARRAPRR